MKKSNHEKYAEERDQLIAAGIPENVVDYAISLNPSQRLYSLFSWIFIVIMIVGFVVGAFLWGYFENILDENTINAANSVNGILYSHNFGIAGLIALFAWIFMIGVVVYYSQNFSKKIQSSMFVYSILDKKNARYLKSKKFAEQTEHQNDPRRFIKNIINGRIQLFLWPAIFLTALSFATLERELNTYTIYTEDGYIAKPLFPWDVDKSDKWENTQLVELGCNHITGRNASEDIVYDVTFAGGQSQRLSSAIPVSGSWLDNIEKIDKILVYSGAEFQRWRWLKRDPLHPKCLAYYKRKYSRNDYQRLKKILRIGKF